MNVVSFVDEAQARFEEIRRQCSRLKTMDLRIASVALVSDATLLSRNARDFRQVPRRKGPAQIRFIRNLLETTHLRKPSPRARTVRVDALKTPLYKIPR